MKLPCVVVRDLLPLYAEKMTEPETQTLIEEHMQECPECRQKYAEFETGKITEEDTAVNTVAPLQTLKKEIRRRKWYTALILGLVVFVIAIVYVYHTGSLMPVEWEEGLLTVKGVQTVTPEDTLEWPCDHIVTAHTLPSDGYSGTALLLEMDGRIEGVETEVIEEDGSVTAIIQGFGRSTVSGKNVSQYGQMAVSPLPDRVIYGYQEPQALLWGEPLNGGVEVLPRLTLNYYVIIAAMMAGLSGILWIIVRKKHGSWIVRQVFFAPVCYILAHFLIMGLRSISFFITRDFCFILLTACALYAFVSLLWQVWLGRRKTV